MLYTNAVHWFVTGGQCVEAVFSLPAEFNKNMTPSDSEQRDWLNKSSQVTFIYIALLTIQIVSKQLHNIKMGK